MAISEIKVPQMGEGLTEVRLLEFLKRPGDTVTRDELIYTMETDKATLEVESPESGVLTEWLAAEGDVLPIGAPIARIQHVEAQSSMPHPSSEQPRIADKPRASDSGRLIPPRTRAYARELGLSEQALAIIPSAAGKLMPADIDAYKASLGKSGAEQAISPGDGATTFHDRPLSDRQRTLNFHMKRSAQTVIPGTVSRPIDWEDIRNQIARLREQPSVGRPTEFQAFAYCVAQAIHSCPKFQCALVRDDTVRHYEHLQIGVAVALADGELTTAVVPEADTLSFSQFITKLQERIQSARAGNDQADATVQMLLSYLGAHGIRDAVPVLVAPAAAVMFLGEAYTQDDRLVANVALTFDHRLINGVEAADLLNSLVLQLRQFRVSDGQPD